jgi:hypothetical protein
MVHLLLVEPKLTEPRATARKQLPARLAPAGTVTAATAAISTATAKPVTAAAPAGGTRLARACFIYRKATPIELGAVERFNGSLGSCVIRHFNEAEAPGLSGVTVLHQLGTFHLTIGREGRFKILFGCLEREVPDVNILHGVNRSSCSCHMAGCLPKGRFILVELVSAGN